MALLTENYELTENIEEADAILVRSANMHEMEIPENLKAVARAGAGVNNIPLDALAEAGIPVFNTPGANANAVKELVIAGMLLASRDIVGGIGWVRDNADDENVGKAAEKAKKAFAGGEIFGKTLGVIGLGAIGKLVVAAAEALGMKVVGYDPFLDAERAAAISETMTFTSELPELLAASSYVTIHVPAMDSTRGMIDAAAIDQMKDGAVFLNFSRDVLVDDAAMAAALESGKISPLRDRLREPCGRQDGTRHRAAPTWAPRPPRRRAIAPRWRFRDHGLPGKRREDPLRERPLAVLRLRGRFSPRWI